MKIELDHSEAAYLQPLLWITYLEMKGEQQKAEESGEPKQVIDMNRQMKELVQGIMLKIQKQSLEEVVPPILVDHINLSNQKEGEIEIQHIQSDPEEPEFKHNILGERVNLPLKEAIKEFEEKWNVLAEFENEFVEDALNHLVQHAEFRIVYNEAMLLVATFCPKEIEYFNVANHYDKLFIAEFKALAERVREEWIIDKWLTQLSSFRKFI